ncbi:MAG: VOC family protein [Chloroflexota bacterium]
MSGTVEGVFHAAISVPDMAEAVAYYRDLLGLRVTFDDHHDPAAIGALFGVPDPRMHAVVVGCPDGSEIELVVGAAARPAGRAASRATPGSCR